MIPALLSTASAGAVVVTPNLRLARHLHRGYDESQREAGHGAWRTPSILPYPAWLQELWQAAIAAEASLARTLLLSGPQSALLWTKTIAADGTPLLDVRGAAELAADAWATMHAWSAGGDSWRAWERGRGADDDPARFAAWASGYAAELKRLGAIDMAQLPDVLASLPVGAPLWRNAALFAGFIAITPQLGRLRAALAARGVEISDVETGSATSGSAVRTCAGTTRQELASALTWARRGALEQPGIRTGIVIDNLAAKRVEVLAMADEILSPALMLSASSETRPYEISLGVPLAEIALVRTALDLISIARGPLPSGEAAAMLRSPYLRGADAGRGRRAEIEREWLREGRIEITLSDAIAALERRSPDLGAAWRDGRDAMRLAHPSSPREWADAWRAWIDAAGWPGSRALDSGEFQARKAWEDVLADFATLGAVEPRLSAGNAVERLLELARNRLFQPEGGGAGIQILGMLEASGLAFDALWVAGLSADRWPPAPAPNPLLPIAWQRERNVARSSAQRELEYARTLTQQFASAGGQVIFSSAQAEGDRKLAPSTLIMAYPTAPAAPATASWTLAIHREASLETLTDDRAPPVALDAVVRGGARLVQSQSDCPFQAMARFRLGAERWPAPLLGLSPRERGILVHASFASFWDALREHDVLSALDESALASRIARAVESGIAELAATRWRGLPAVVRAGETQRLTGLLQSWLAVDRERPPFRVCAIEQRTTLKLSGIAMNVRFDRVDALADGGVAIIDYKSGQADAPVRWFEPRPRSAQLGVYTLAQREASPQLPVRAVAYANLCPDQVQPLGIAADKGAWPALVPVESLKPFSGWAEVEAWWRASIGALAAEISEGRASVTPRLTTRGAPMACKQCDLQPLCRIESVRMLDRFEADDE